MEAFCSEVIDVIQDVTREVCGERVDILAALGERDWVKLKEDRWGLGAGQQMGCATSTRLRPLDRS
jgi:hypothetical protein